jgi:SanA protein
VNAPAKSTWRRWLRWAFLIALAVALVIAALVDYCIHTKEDELIGKTVVWHLAVLLLCIGLIPFLRLPDMWIRLLKDLGLALVPAFILVVVYANITAIWASRGRVFDDVSKVPATKVGLVFGTSDRVNGRENLYFRYRIEAATALWNAGKIKTILVSGDNRSHRYNEPEKMRRALVKQGIPDDRIAPDYAGFRTLDSVVRAKRVFGADSLLFISQRFQNERAIYLAKANGIDAYGFEARDVQTQAGLKTKIREVGARVKMWLDVNFLNTPPKYFGKREQLPE